MRTLTAAQIESMQYRRGKPSFAVSLQYKTAAWHDTGAVIESDIIEYTFDKDDCDLLLKESASLGNLTSYYPTQMARLWITETLTDGATVISAPSPVYFPYAIQYEPPERVRILATPLALQPNDGVDPDQAVDDLLTALGASRDIVPAFIAGQEWFDYTWGVPGEAVTISMGEIARNLGKRYMVEAFAREGDVLFQNRYNSPNRIVAYTPFTSRIQTWAQTNYNAPIRGISWVDENGVLHTSTGAQQPIHFMGYAPSTATQAIMDLIDFVLESAFEFTQWPDLRLENGDYIRITGPSGGTFAGMINCIHELKRAANGQLRWRQTVRAAQVPGTISTSRQPNRNIPRAPSPLSLELDTTAFNTILSGADQSVQTAIDKLDDHQHVTSHVLGMYPNAVVGAGLTRYLAPYHATLLAAAVTWPWLVASTLKTLKVVTTTAQPASGSLVIDLYVAGAGSAVTITIPAGSPAGTYADTAHEAAIAADQSLNVRIINNAAGNSANIGAVTLVSESPTTDQA